MATAKAKTTVKKAQSKTAPKDSGKKKADSKPKITPASRTRLLAECLEAMKGYIPNSEDDSSIAEIRLTPKKFPDSPEKPESWAGTKASIPAVVYAILNAEGTKLSQITGTSELDVKSLGVIAKKFGLEAKVGSGNLDEIFDFLIPTRISQDYKNQQAIVEAINKIADRLDASDNQLPANAVMRILKQQLASKQMEKGTISPALKKKKGELAKLTAKPVLRRKATDTLSESQWDKIRHEDFIVGGSSLASCFPATEDGEKIGFGSPDMMFQALRNKVREPANNLMKVGTHMQEAVEEEVLNHPDIKALNGRRIDDGEEMLFRHPDVKKGCATTDMMIGVTYPSGATEDVLVEIKTAAEYYSTYYHQVREFTDKGIEYTGKGHIVPHRIRIQVQWQMMVTGLKTAYVAVFPTNMNYPVKEFKRSAYISASSGI